MRLRATPVHSSIEYAEAGGVIAYGMDYADNCRSSPQSATLPRRPAA
jgi:hypothetical protein